MATEEQRAGQGVVVLADMLFASRVRGVGQAAGVPVTTVTNPARLLDAAAAGPASLVIVDLELRSGQPADAIRALKSDARTQDIPVLGFASHTNTAAIEAGRAAGADRVLARSAFVRNLPELVRDGLKSA